MCFSLWAELRESHCTLLTALPTKLSCSTRTLHREAPVPVVRVGVGLANTMLQRTSRLTSTVPVLLLQRCRAHWSSTLTKMEHDS